MFYLPGREYNTSQTSWRWTGNRTIEDQLIASYAEVYENLIRHDPSYPTPEHLLSITKVGNVDFEGEMEHDTDGSNMIRDLLLDNDPRPIYLQAWGGTNTIARALKSLEDQYRNTSHWTVVNSTVSRKAIIMASGFQDETYVNYILPHWPQVRVETLSASATYFGYNCNRTGEGNTAGLPDYHEYFTGTWTRKNIQTGPYGKNYRSWLDGQQMEGDQLDGFGNLTLAQQVDPWCPAIDEKYAFLGEGDDITYFSLLHTGIEEPSNPNLGSWGGRGERNTTYPNFWVSVSSEAVQGNSSANITAYTSYRWIPAIQNDFAARMQWTWTPEYKEGNHHPTVSILGPETIRAEAGSIVELAAAVSDPDGDQVDVSWWQYLEEGTYPEWVEIAGHSSKQASVKIPSDAAPGQTISIILQGTDDGEFPLTRYDRVTIEVSGGK